MWHWHLLSSVSLSWQVSSGPASMLRRSAASSTGTAMHHTHLALAAWQQQEALMSVHIEHRHCAAECRCRALVSRASPGDDCIVAGQAQVPQQEALVGLHDGHGQHAAVDEEVDAVQHREGRHVSSQHRGHPVDLVCIVQASACSQQQLQLEMCPCIACICSN